MGTRRMLLALIAVLSVFICVAGAGVAGLAYLRLAPGDGARLLVLDDRRRMLLVGRDGSERVLAENLSGDLFRYPSPAPDAQRVAYIGRDGADVTLNSLNLRTGEQIELYRSSDAPPLYMTWSPDGQTLSFLSNRQVGLGVHTVAADGSAEAELLGTTTGSSYFAWQPSSERLLIHIGGSSFDGGAVQIFERGSSEPARALDDPGLFQTPAWSVDGSAFFYVAQPAVEGPLRAEAVESRLTRIASDGADATVLVAEPQAAILFSRSPASDTIAYVTAGPRGFGALKLVGADGGEPRLLSRPGEAIPAFFWSPDGSQIAYLTFEPRPDALPRLTWHVVATAGGEARELVSFAPSQAFAGVVNFFDAYAYAFDLWSPDSRRLVYATDAGIYEVDVTSGEETRRADGSLAMWVRQ